MIRTLKSNSGLSLMEILVAGLMFGILAVTVVLVISPIMMAYSRANSLAEYNTILDSIGNVITSEFSGANRNEVPEDTVVYGSKSLMFPPSSETDSVPVVFYGSNILRFSSSSGIVTFDAPNGHLLRNGHPVFPEGFYGGMQISFDVDNPSGADFLIEVAIGRPGTATDEKISRNFAVRPIMLG